MRRHGLISLYLMALFSVSVIPYSPVQAQGATAFTDGASAVDFDLICPDPVKIASPQAFEIVFDIELVNTGSETDSYDLWTYEDLPLNSYSSFCFGGSCLRPDIDSLKAKLPLDSGEQGAFSVHVSPAGTVGGGTVKVKVRSNADPGLEKSIVIHSITHGTQILVVDDDGGNTIEKYYEQALGDAVTFGTWPLCCKQVTLIDLGFFDTVIWLTGNAYPSLTPEDQTAIAAYLAGGGNLFMSGQDIGWSLCDPAGSDYSLAACEFYRTFLHANYVASSSGDLSLAGVNGDAVSHGLAIDLSGGDGADNQTSPSLISPLAPAQTVFTYDGSQAGAIWTAAGTSKVVYFAFGFEAINSEAMRRQVMNRILDRFAYDGDKGDVNNDGSINVLDVLQGANIILTIVIPTEEQRWRADFDLNGQINVLDLMGMVNIILAGGRQ